MAHRIAAFIELSRACPPTARGRLASNAAWTMLSCTPAGPLEHAETRIRVLTERAGEPRPAGCQVPIGAYAPWQEWKSGWCGLVAARTAPGSSATRSAGPGRGRGPGGAGWPGALLAYGADAILAEVYWHERDRLAIRPLATASDGPLVVRLAAQAAELVHRCASRATHRSAARC